MAAAGGGAVNGDNPSLRRLPWTGDGGRPCYLSTDGTGPVSRLADRIEAAQLASAAGLLSRAQRVLAGSRRLTALELGWLAGQLADALGETLCIADSRGQRLALPDDDGGPDDEPGGADDDASG